jgi:hypothetical protein
MCAYSLDHITPSTLGVIRRAGGVQSHQREHTTQFLGTRGPRLSLYDTLWTFV